MGFGNSWTSVVTLYERFFFYFLPVNERLKIFRFSCSTLIVGFGLSILSI